MKASKEFRLRAQVAEAEESVFEICGMFHVEVRTWNNCEYSGHCVVTRAEKVIFFLGQKAPRLRVVMTREAEFRSARDGGVEEVIDGDTTDVRSVRKFPSWVEAFRAFRAESEADPRFKLERPTSW